MKHGHWAVPIRHSVCTKCSVWCNALQEMHCPALSQFFFSTSRKRNENSIFPSEREIIEPFLLEIFWDRDSCQWLVWGAIPKQKIIANFQFKTEILVTSFGYKFRHIWSYMVILLIWEKTAKMFITDFWVWLFMSHIWEVLRKNHERGIWEVWNFMCWAISLCRERN